jgi:DHA3 family macrolide efflux protein-like MFS transporter
VVWGGGMLIGGVILSIFKLKGSKVVAVNVMYVLLGLTFILSGVLPASWFVGFVMVTAIGGISLSVFNGCFTAIVQTEVSPEKLGRVFSLYYSLHFAKCNRFIIHRPDCRSYWCKHYVYHKRLFGNPCGYSFV